MNLLLDTNALIWLLDPDSGKLGESTIKSMQKAASVYVSAASILEMQIKAMLGKLEIPSDLLSEIIDSNLKLLSVSPAHSMNIVGFPKLKSHDPFDRVLLSQAKTENMTFVTSDELLLKLTSTGVKMYDARV